MQRIQMNEFLQINKKMKLAVIFHLYYPDLIPEFKSYLENIDYEYDLYLTIPDNISVNYVDLKFVPKNIYVYRHPNRGRDIAPFIYVYREIYNNYDFFLKIHSKKSPHIHNANDLRKELLENIVGSKILVNNIITLFNEIDVIGLIAANSKIGKISELIGNNRKKIEELCNKLHYDSNKVINNYLFPIGSFYWFRRNALKPLLDLNLTYDNFEAESGQLDGCLHHAIERMIGAFTIEQGYRIFGASKDGNIVPR